MADCGYVCSVVVLPCSLLPGISGGLGYILYTMVYAGGLPSTLASPWMALQTLVNSDKGGAAPLSMLSKGTIGTA